MTITEVAREAGVSKGTVSRVLAGTYAVSPVTADKVNRAVKALGYLPSVRARALATGKANAIAVVVSEPFDLMFADPTFSVIMKGVFDAMSNTEYTPIVLQVQSEIEQRKAIYLLRNQGVDAVIHLSPWEDNGLLEALADSSLPVVLCGQTRNERYVEKFSLVYADDVEGARNAARHLLDKGVQKPIAITGAITQPAAEDRVNGYREVFDSQLSDDRAFYCGWSEQDGVQAIQTVLQRQIAFDGVLAGSDRIARGVLTVLRAKGIMVPDEVKVIGFDDHAIATEFYPELTTIAQPMHEQGRLAFETAVAMAEGKEATTYILNTQLIERSTT
ncbi:MAG: LacI family DNA-binding transcriptional regulator [Actinomycetaceae bacterium]|nr:LacI family DNA-binding transcriptional regulator [Actinomycetaceae bacterium]